MCIAWHNLFLTIPFQCWPATVKGACFFAARLGLHRHLWILGCQGPNFPTGANSDKGLWANRFLLGALFWALDNHWIEGSQCDCLEAEWSQKRGPVKPQVVVIDSHLQETDGRIWATVNRTCFGLHRYESGPNAENPDRASHHQRWEMLKVVTWVPYMMRFSLLPWVPFILGKCLQHVQKVLLQVQSPSSITSKKLTLKRSNEKL